MRNIRLLRLLRIREESPNLTIDLKPDERIDDLQCHGYKIIQHGKMFCFGMDAVLLANFSNVNKDCVHMDLGTGTGVIPILLAAKTKGSHFTGLEIQEYCAEMAERSVRLNHLEDKVDIAHGDIKEVFSYYKKASFDVVTSNPPYIRGSHGLENPNEPKNIARHEILVSLEEVIAAAAYLLKPGGSFYMVHKPFRLAEIFECLMKYKLEPKKMQLVHPYIDKEPNMVLIQAVLGGNSMLKIEPPLIVYESPGVYTRQLLDTYEGEMK
jgi:tRNA1(Val) A37 N6-methylase TrmN6